MRSTIQLDATLERALKRFMEERGYRDEAAALEAAVAEGLRGFSERGGEVDFTQWLGMGRQAPVNAQPRFQSDDDLWG